VVLAVLLRLRLALALRDAWCFMVSEPVTAHAPDHNLQPSNAGHRHSVASAIPNVRRRTIGNLAYGGVPARNRTSRLPLDLSQATWEQACICP